MIRRIEEMADRPAKFGVGEDILSALLDSVRFTDWSCFSLTMLGDWAVETPSGADIAGHLALGHQQIVFFHIVAEGSYISKCGERLDHLQTGDVIVYPRGARHVLSNREGIRPLPVAKLVPLPPWPQPASFMSGNGTGPATRLICGFLRCEAVQFNPVLGGLPDVLVVTAANRKSDAWLSSSIDLLIKETDRAVPGARCMTQRLVEVLFIAILRHAAETLNNDAGQWTSAIRDRIVARALSLLHNASDTHWTVDMLASGCGTSRSRLAARFHDTVGCGPIEYLTRLRLQQARTALETGAANVSQAAHLAGYASEAAFSRAFKRAFGNSPSAHRPSNAAKKPMPTVG